VKVSSLQLKLLYTVSGVSRTMLPSVPGLKSFIKLDFKEGIARGGGLLMKMGFLNDFLG
jgi:hypothetical protein